MHGAQTLKARHTITFQMRKYLWDLPLCTPVQVHDNIVQIQFEAMESSQFKLMLPDMNLLIRNTFGPHVAHYVTYGMPTVLVD